MSLRERVQWPPPGLRVLTGLLAVVVGLLAWDMSHPSECPTVEKSASTQKIAGDAVDLGKGRKPLPCDRAVKVWMPGASHFLGGQDFLKYSSKQARVAARIEDALKPSGRYLEIAPVQVVPDLTVIVRSRDSGFAERVETRFEVGNVPDVTLIRNLLGALILPCKKAPDQFARGWSR